MSALKQTAKKILGLAPMKYILFESKPDYTDNSMALYSYIRENKLLSKYKLLWISKNPDSAKSGIPTFVLKDSLFSRLKRAYLIASSRALIFCNEPIEKLRGDQLSVFLCHGSKSKKTRGVYEAPKDLDCILVQADVFKDALKYEYNLSDHTQMLKLGYPRNDDLLRPVEGGLRGAFETDYKKLIVWYPTFRQNKSGERVVSSITLPVIHDVEAAKKLNERARENGVLIVLKPHFAQDMRLISQQNFSNIRIISDDFLKEKGIRSYQLLASSDAMITDYSSVYYDYLLTNKPIGLVWEDYEEYKAKQGFAMDPDMIYSGGEKIFTVDDFCGFIDRVAQGEDVLRDARAAIRDLTNEYRDDQSCKRVAEYIAGQL